MAYKSDVDQGLHKVLISTTESMRNALFCLRQQLNVINKLMLLTTDHAINATQLNSTLFVPNIEKQSGNKMIKDEKWRDGTGLKGTEMHWQ